MCNGGGTIVSLVLPMYSVIEQLRTRQVKERCKIVLWKQPITTLHYFARELVHEAKKLTIGYDLSVLNL